MANTELITELNTLYERASGDQVIAGATLIYKPLGKFIDRYGGGKIAKVLNQIDDQEYIDKLSLQVKLVNRLLEVYNISGDLVKSGLDYYQNHIFEPYSCLEDSLKLNKSPSSIEHWTVTDLLNMSEDDFTLFVNKYTDRIYKIHILIQDNLKNDELEAVNLLSEILKEEEKTGPLLYNIKVNRLVNKHIT